MKLVERGRWGIIYGMRKNETVKVWKDIIKQKQVFPGQIFHDKTYETLKNVDFHVIRTLFCRFSWD